MKSKRRMFLLVSAFSVPVTLGSGAFAATDPYAYSPQDVLNGDSAVVASANYGKGIIFGDIDTGIAPSIWFNPGYNQQGLENIDTTGGNCLGRTCKVVNPIKSPTDKNSHGTFTASEIVGGAPAYGYNSMAPAGTVMSVQVLNAQGSGTSTAVANGIKFAVDHGAMVLNLSLGPSGSASQQAAFYQSLASAINYAASKNVYVVFAAGNSSQAFSNGATITGFTNAAIQHMLIMGSTTVGNGVDPTTTHLSSFSDSAGSGKFLSTTGQSYSIADMFLVADGENIWGASNSNRGQCRGYTCVQQDSGTSMAAPQGTGAIGLLEAKWAILRTNGTAAQVLEATGTDMGATGTDTTYGSGFLNLIQAFQPVGGTYAVTQGGAFVPVNSSTRSTLTGGAFGALHGISSRLKNYTVFDSFRRNFTVDLSGLIATRPSGSLVSNTAAAPKTSISSAHFADGSSLAFGNASDDVAPIAQSGTAPGNSGWFMSFTDASGSTMAAGNGFPASASFADALWGAGSDASVQSDALGISNSLLNLAEGGSFAAFGTKLDGATRMAFSWSQTQSTDMPTSLDITTPQANAFSAGITHRLAEGWTGGVTFGLLNEQDGMLGTTYGGGGPVSFGDSHASMSVGISSAVALGDKRSLLVDAAIARTDSASLAENSLVSGVSDVYARSIGAALVQRDALDAGDNLSLSLRAPLRVFSGSASLAMSSVDGNGNPVMFSQRVNLRPTGNEVDLAMGYQAPLRDALNWNVSVEGRHDADNISGANDASVIFGTSLRF